ncbi:hypothetical protein LMG27198_39710 [Methylocystis echinoides]|uniref:Uncharacterized protein n=1 Tax=Methylocystis echinoides TaxID=29468 RepID=A0A9W6GXT5_9HYPH|nr:hypothetical protein LMG27198_39710 [Methylocystis echinoides]
MNDTTNTTTTTHTTNKRHKRKHSKTGRRVMVGVKLTPEELDKLEALIKSHTEKTGVPATKSSVLSQLISEAA